ncbi:metal ABC transporter solute-binding protein, Zn/Mn family [Spirochaeta africana]|uniref:ABC-type metal ion transport system, periplasmic component/surface adhesin n=1 Tax=Spirochaeta africana (strain ATCC 700263 / DSM 8902 / Z-7692) TaxID=889378 RepID=H9UHR1_SPIAZ|nr:zinc ABC transporter substrate-binding protein [Spirochaeta africana]AFG37054.1 ABC-type metal ion transport system, periplasmic component/surface adhesin [Spirochaeta africana DSM 8902]
MKLRASISIVCVLLIVGAVAGCTEDNHTAASGSPIVVTTFTVLQDLTRMVTGDVLDVRTITPVGGEVHEWELIPSNFVDIEQAALVLYNGLDLEEWMGQVRSTVTAGTPVVPVADRSGFATLPIRIGELTGNPDPHVWMNPEGAIAYLDVILKAVSDLVPEHADRFAQNAAQAQQEIRQAAGELQGLIDTIPSEQRTLVTSEAAFLYFADAFGLEHDAIWGSNDEEEGTPRQIARVVDLIRDRTIPVAFYESTISNRHVRSVAEDTGIRVAGPLYVDSLGVAGSEAESYIGMLRHNVELIVRELR